MSLAHAQSDGQNASDSDALVETEQVISSRLKKMDIGGPSPEVVISGADIARAGYNSISDLLRDNPISSFGAAKETSGLAARAGLATIDIRGMGASNTLVLLNGMRMAPISGGDTVDMNRIPVSIVKEIRIIKDDLSSIYGSDAIGGVVDVITHDAYNHLTVSGGVTVSELGGGNRYDFNIIGGSSSATTSTFYSLSHRQNNEIFANQREWSREGVSTTGSPGSYMNVNDPGVWYTDPNCTTVMDAGPQGNFCTFNYARYSTTLPKLTQTAAFARMEHRLSDFMTFYTEALFNRNRTTYVMAPAPGIFNIPGAVADGFGLPNHIAGSDIQVRYRMLELGNRVDDQENNFLGLTSGFKWDFLDTWTAKLAGTYGREKNDAVGVGNAVAASLERLIQDGSFNPFAPAGSRGDVSSAVYQTWSKQVSNFYMADLQLEGEILEVAGKPVVLTVGQSYMERDYDNRVDALSKRQETFTGAGSDGYAERTVHSTYGQLTAKPFSRLDLFLSGRYDKFSDFGDTFNPKFGFKFRIDDDLMLRGTVGTGYKAPALATLYASQSESYITFVDWYACEQERTLGGATPSCSPQQYRTVYGGNPNLKEITSFSYNTGLVYNPSSNFDINLDFWSIVMKGLSWGASGGALEDVTRAELAGITPDAYGIHMNRTAGGYLDATNPIIAPSMNIGERKTAGLDLELNWALPAPVGVFRISEVFSYRLWDITIPFPGLPERDYVKEHWVSRWRNQLRLGYQLAGHDFGFIVVSTDKYLNALQSGYVDGFHRLDFAYNYSGFENASFTLGVQNLLRLTPPLDETDPNNMLNESLYSQTGPVVYSNFVYHF
ncbi:MAG: TonB-dependent receptor [Bdellovibrionaceae bacterium]|nr:TonB-dependent receptor [Pseudobdellovibrionaceae bacterium]